MLSRGALELILNMVNSPGVNFPGSAKFVLVEIDTWATKEVMKLESVNGNESRLPAEAVEELKD